MRRSYPCPALAVACCVCQMLLMPVQAQAQEPSFWKDTKQGLRLAGHGFVTQFTYAPSQQTLLLGTAVTLGLSNMWSTDFDDGILDATRDTHELTNNIVEIIGDQVTVAMSFAPLITYVAARRTDNDKLRAFSIESFGAMMLAYGETVVLSQIPTHERPRDAENDVTDGFFNTALRGKYSWPSGHLVAPMVLTLKTYDYYGWKAALLPAAVTTISAASRMAGGYHYPTDLTAAFALSLAAHLATKKLASDGPFSLRATLLPEGGTLLSSHWRF